MPTQEQHEALAAALAQHIANEGLMFARRSQYDSPWEFVRNARAGFYGPNNAPVGPDAINMTREQFVALAALVYG